MMFIMHVAFSFGLIALAVGVCLYVWSLQAKLKKARDVTQFFGVAIILLSIFGMLCSGYYAMKYWSEGYFEQPMPMMSMQEKKMMEAMHGNMMMQNGGASGTSSQHKH